MTTALVWLIKERQKFDIVFVDGFRTLGVSAILGGKLAGKKIILKPENIGEMSGAFFDGGLKKIGLTHSHWLVRPVIALRNAILRQADALCPISLDLEKEFLQEGIEWSNVHLIPNAYDSSRFFPISVDEKGKLRSKFSIDENRIVAIFTGRLDAMKGPQHLVRMWQEIAETNNHPLLLMVGPDSHGIFNCGNEIRDYIRTHNLQDDILMTGGVRNVEEYLQVSDFYCFPSQGGEGLPTSVIEAMACGLPVITTRSTGVMEIVTPETGLAVEPTDFEAFKVAIVKMLTDEKLRNSLGQAAAARAGRMYPAEIVSRQYLQIFRAVLREKDPEAT
jgi:glycosyltransferase involved in cell wall biosynthesis